jgi:ABC-type lipoprotein release transport system permease subunit
MSADAARNPKAEAKAAKAYAKAMRPSYKKKRFIVPLGLVALTIAGTAMSGGSDNSKPTASTNTPQVSQSEKPAAQETAAAEKKPEMTTSQKNAVESAKNYVDIQAFSKKGLIQQLSSSAGDGFPRADARFAVNHIHVDWNEQAVKSAREYLDTQSFSKSSLIQQLSSSAGSGFTPAQAQYAVSKVY